MWVTDNTISASEPDSRSPASATSGFVIAACADVGVLGSTPFSAIAFGGERSAERQKGYGRPMDEPSARGIN
ncbi:hypothetical protein [Actinoplanes aureus]|uniref:Uncharacterized protein n=1 Tax=Actinoplanes aureus TaxID=2792083 RepID=A0A931G7F3_9ACTN|nr:hypothetical protein [Actinoplanes aureus]MBG0568184.1 hypothetical protein [Actinoplanes aureus]